MNKKYLTAASCFLAAFVLWTAAVATVDLQAIGPEHSTVGFAALNRFVHNLTGVHMILYTLTDWLSLVAVAIMFGFAVLGLVQWGRRKRLCKVDRSILGMGAFYVLVLLVYLLFEELALNVSFYIPNNGAQGFPSSTS